MKIYDTQYDSTRFLFFETAGEGMHALGVFHSFRSLLLLLT